MRTRGKLGQRCGAAATIVTAICMLAASGAHAADRVYWAEADKIATVGLDGEGVSQLGDTGSATFVVPRGSAIDPPTETIYWVNRGTNQGTGAGISFARLDGSGGDVLTIPGAWFNEPYAVAVDPLDQRIYWANRTPASIWVADLPDGSNAHQLATGQATVVAPGGLALDPVGRRLYWVNGKGVAFANLDRAEGQDLNTAGAPTNGTRGLAIDPFGQRIYWANIEGNSIGFANLDGSGGGTLNTAGATISLPQGVAIDPYGGRVYWANRNALNVGGGISFANLDGSGGGGNLIQGRFGESAFPVLRLAPQPTAPPAVSGGTESGATLTCSPGTWRPDLVQAFNYAAPRSFSHQWSRDGADLPGATQSSLTAAATGEYRCEVTAENAAGTASQTSAAHRVSSPPPQPPKPPTTDMRLTLSLASARVPASGPVAIRVVNGSPFPLAGKLAAQTTGSASKRPVRLVAKPFQVAAQSKAIVKLKLPKPLGSLLARKHRLPLALNATVTDPARNTYLVKQTVVPKLKT